ncbi:DinB family protein [Actinokineospora bangkokensis]|uniref:Mini-circle protein n=1 Tax=Actinokineospora bangkokensis TaxID=1193682 RepID=A0A1Q9LLY6_9PSEU|nr:DinB family protein [Actinokineospora bangkokensis]OLR93031.1 hypothetical protein BJP25_18935 [Actinokineospora bangkokensis]
MTASTTLDGERTDLIAELATARAALVAAVDGLTDEQAAATPTVSALSLGGLVKHVTAVEENWTRFAVDGPDAVRYDLPEGVTWADLANGTAREYPQWAVDHQLGFTMLPGETLAGLLARYEEVAARTDEVVATADLSTTYPLPAAPWHQPGEVRSIRRVFGHVITETAQHAGHADIIRETLDGKRAG